MPLGRRSEPFSHPDWLFEVKWDGFRSLVYVQKDECRLISRNGNDFKSFSVLNQSILAELHAGSAILDGEIVSLDEDGKTQFRDLLFRRGEPRFYAFDLLRLDGAGMGRNEKRDRTSRNFFMKTLILAARASVGK